MNIQALFARLVIELQREGFVPRHYRVEHRVYSFAAYPEESEWHASHAAPTLPGEGGIVPGSPLEYHAGSMYGLLAAVLFLNEKEGWELASFSGPTPSAWDYERNEATLILKRFVLMEDPS